LRCCSKRASLQREGHDGIRDVGGVDNRPTPCDNDNILLPIISEVRIGVACPPASSSAFHSSVPIAPSKARMRRSFVAAMKTNPLAVDRLPPIFRASGRATVSMPLIWNRRCQAISVSGHMDEPSYLFILFVPTNQTSADLQYCRHLATSFTASDPAGTSYSSSIVAGIVHLFFFTN
jgi:hypothetical protein